MAPEVKAAVKLAEPEARPIAGLLKKLGRIV